MNKNAPKSCDINAKGSSCCSPAPAAAEEVNLKQHWDKAYTNNLEEKLGWFETDLSPTLRLIKKANVASNARIINIGAGSTTLIDELLKLRYSQLIATDISNVALTQLKDRIGNQSVELIVDDLTNPTTLDEIAPVDLWIDRAVLHFFTEEKDQDTYFNLLKSILKKKGYALLAQFDLNGAQKCSGLSIHRYSAKMLADKLGKDFKMIEGFDYTYTMPSGDLRPYVYALFRKQ